MSYRIAGIDVHKKMLAVVVSDVEVDGEYQFERVRYSSSPEHLRFLAEWLITQQVGGSSDGINRTILETGLGGTRTVLETNLPGAGRRRPDDGNLTSGASPIESRTTGTQEGFPRCGTSGEATGRR